jgi:UDP-N-acetylmuramate dehydrogenase
MFKENVLLSVHSSYKIGGPAKYFFEAKTFEELIQTLKEASQLDKMVFILGGGTNILFPDKGLNDVVIKIGLDYINPVRNPSRPRVGTAATSGRAVSNGVNQDGNILTIGAGTLITQLLNYSIVHSLSGLEWAGGLPGTLGGAIRGNAGAFRGEIKDSIVEVLSMDQNEPDKSIIRNNQECLFSYRNSIFKNSAKNEIILEAKIRVENGDSSAIKKAIEGKIQCRLERNPMEYPNCGSIFKNVPLEIFPKRYINIVENQIKTDPFPVVPTAFLISECGLKGVTAGGAMVSPKHPNFIVNFDNARAEDVKNLIKLVKEKVYDKFQVNLEEEILIL